ncbi:MAG: DedA family protein [Pyrinomonadaceae bacterium]
MDHALTQIIETYGIYAVFALCTVEGDITLLLSGVMAHSGFFGHYSFFKVLIFGTLGGMAGDLAAYFVGRRFHDSVKNYSFYQMAQPRIERLVDKFGPYAIVISKYIYGLRIAITLFYGIGRMPFWRFLWLDAVSCFIWVFLLSGAGYFFSGAITSIIGDFQQIGIALFFIVLTGVIVFYVLERFWLSEKVEEASPETIHKIEETLHGIEEVAHVKLHDLSEKLHIAREHPAEDKDAAPAAAPPLAESKKAARK